MLPVRATTAVRTIAPVACLLAFVCTAPGRTGAEGLDAIPTKLSPLQGGLLTLDGADTPLRGSYRLALGLDYARGLLALRLGDEKIGDLVESRLDLHVLGSWSPFSWLQLGADMPVVVHQESGLDQLADETGTAQGTLDSPVPGDLRLLGKVRVLDQASFPLGIAGIVEARLPTGDAESYAGERGPVLGLRGAAERDLGPLRLAGELGYRLRDLPARALNVYVGDEVTYGIGAAYRLPETLPLAAWTITAEIAGSTPARSLDASGDALVAPREALLGISALSGPLQITVGGGRGLVADSGYGREALRLFVVVSWEHLVEEGDRDGDGVPNEDDACIDDPGPAALDGCPDRDGDEIPDKVDRCPDVPGVAAQEGCPAGPGAELVGDRIELEGAVNFDTGQATLKPDARPVLDAVARVMREHPEVERVRVEGHTDSVGPAAANRDLSQRRAAAVVGYLESRGIERSRLEPVGKGEDEPIADNATALGRASNRRVEFEVVGLD